MYIVIQLKIVCKTRYFQLTDYFVFQAMKQEVDDVQCKIIIIIIMIIVERCSIIIL